jgi:ABC-type uncharacterized transport system permease subunit
MQRDAGVPSTVVSVIEALLILGVVAAQAIRVRRVAVMADNPDSRVSVA